MLKGNLFRIYPTKEQKNLLEQHFGAARFVYNKLLHVKSTMYSQCRVSVSKLVLGNHIQVLKDCYPWLKDICAHSILAVNNNLDSAFQRFFKGLGEYPKEHKKKDNHFSYQYIDSYQINLITSEIYLPNIGWLPALFHRELFNQDFISNNLIVHKVNGQQILKHDFNKEFLRTLTVSRTSAGRYHVSILTEDGMEKPVTQVYNQSTTIGVDVGIKTFAALSTGELIENPRHLKKSLKKLKMLQKRVSRKVNGSKNRRKAAKKLAKLHQLVSNQRNDFQHKVSIKLIRENQAIAVETLNIKGIVKNHKLAQAVSDSAWYSFVSKLTYKANWYGKTVLKIGQWEPSSKECHVCGYHNKELTLKDREWQCPECKTLHDRDINAAINIKKFAIQAYQITAGTAGRACGVTGNSWNKEAGSLTALA